MTSPCQRSLKKLRDEGWYCEVVEHWNAFTKRRKDLFGFGDILCVRDDVALLVQTTSDVNVSHRVSKILELPGARFWLGSPTRKIIVHGWGKKGSRGERKRWECREVEIGADALGPVVMMQPSRRQKPVQNLDLFARRKTKCAEEVIPEPNQVRDQAGFELFEK